MTIMQEKETADMEGCNLGYSTLNEAVEEWKDSLDYEVKMPCTISVLGFTKLDKDVCVPSGLQILDDLYDRMYDNGFIDDYTYSEFSENLLNKAEELSKAIKEEAYLNYEPIKEYVVEVGANSCEILEVKEIK